MKLKYNHGGKTESIPLTKKKPEGKRLAVHHDDQNFYAPLVDAGDATASNMRTVFKGEMLAVRALPPPEIENILIAPPTVAVMQGQSATAIVSASGNEAVAGISYSIAHNPTWITIADECILIQPSDNDQGEAVVEVIAKDTGSDASMSAAFVAEALLRPIISSLSIAPPAVTVSQGQSATAQIQAEANSAVTGLSYSLDGAPDWITNDNDTIWVEPTTNDVGTTTVNVVAYDTNSSASAATEFVATAEMIPQIYGVMASPSTVAVEQGETTVVTLSADYNSAVTSIEYSLTDAPSWMTISGNRITCAPTSSDLGTVTVTATARDTGSNEQASTQIVVEAQVLQPKISGITVQGNATIKGDRVAAWRANTLDYPLTCTANSAVTSVRYSLAPSESNPAWLSVRGYASLRAAPSTTNSALGDTATVTIVAYDTGSDATATLPVPVTVTPYPAIGAITLSNTVVAAAPGNPVTITVTAPNANAGVTGIEASLNTDCPSWVSADRDMIIVSPTSGQTGNATITVRAVDTGSTIQSLTVRASVNALEIMPAISNVSVGSSPSLKSDKVVGWQGGTLYYPLTCTANSAVTSVRYSLQSGAPAWMTVRNNVSLQTNPTSVNSALGDRATVTIVAYDTGSHVKATTTVAASVSLRPSIGALTISETDVTGYPGKAATITLSAPNSGVTGLEYSLSAQPSWVTLSGNKIIAAPASGETGYQVISVQAVDTGSNVVSAKSRCSVRASVMPEITGMTVPRMALFSVYRSQTYAPQITAASNATYGISYSLKSDTDWMSINSSKGQITLRVPDSEPFSNNSVTGSYTVKVTDPAGHTIQASNTYAIEMREVISLSSSTPTLITNDLSYSGGLKTTTSSSLVDYRNCWPHTMQVDVTASRSIPSGKLALEGYCETASPPITLTADSNRTVFHIKWVRGNDDTSDYSYTNYPATLQFIANDTACSNTIAPLTITKLKNGVTPVLFTKTI